MLTILCISSYAKGFDFMREAKTQGCRVILLTSKSLENADWPRESLDEIFYIPDKNNFQCNYGSYAFRSNDAFVPPKPNEFDIATFTCAFRALFGT